MRGVDPPSGGGGSGGEMDRLTLMIEEVNDQVRPNEGSLLTDAIQWEAVSLSGGSGADIFSRKIANSRMDVCGRQAH